MLSVVHVCVAPTRAGGGWSIGGLPQNVLLAPHSSLLSPLSPLHLRLCSSLLASSLPFFSPPLSPRDLPSGTHFLPGHLLLGQAEWDLFETCCGHEPLVNRAGFLMRPTVMKVCVWIFAISGYVETIRLPRNDLPSTVYCAPRKCVVCSVLLCVMYSTSALCV